MWQCTDGHQWKSSAAYVKTMNKWCPQCIKPKERGKEKRTIEQMHKTAAKKGGKFLSKVYVSANKKHLWECNKGHQWLMTPSQISNSSGWCPKCKTEK